MAASTTTQHNIATRQQLIEAERSTRKLAQQKRNERKDAFLSAQKQLLKTTEYIQQLDKLSHTLTEDIDDTYNLLNNATITNMTHHFSEDINKFNKKNANHDYNGYIIDPLIQSFDSINSGNSFCNDTYLMNHIDVPFLSPIIDIPLFMNKIQSCLYSSRIYINNTDMDQFEEEYKQKTCISVDEYYSYLSDRELLIQKLLHFMRIYPNKNDKNQQTIHEYYENILPFCLYCLVIILYQTSIHINDINNDALYKLFSDFVMKCKQEIEANIIKSLQFMSDNPFLLIQCLNKYINLLNTTNPIQLKWTNMFKKFYKNTTKSITNISFIHFINNYIFNSSFYKSFESMSNIVCHSLSTDFKQLFQKLSNQSTTSSISQSQCPSFTVIMNNIERNLSAILTFDNHQQLLSYPALDLQRHILPFIEASTNESISQFISALELHLNATNSNISKDNQQHSNAFSLDEEYLEIAICCEKLELFISDIVSKHTQNERGCGISLCLQQMLASIASLKVRALKYWSSAMSVKLFNDVSDVAFNLKQKLFAWNIYHSDYTKTLWKYIVIASEDEEIEELSINIPCQASAYMHDICFQFIQILLMIISQTNVPQSIIPGLEHEFRVSVCHELKKIFAQFFELHTETEIRESLGLQFYFDVAFASKILSVRDGGIDSWQEILTLVRDKYIELVTMEYGNKYLQAEIEQSVQNCLLMYGVHGIGAYDDENKAEENVDGAEEINMKLCSGGNVFARPMKKIARIALLPVASYEIAQPNALQADELSLNNSPLRIGLLNAKLLENNLNDAAGDNQTDKIAQSFNEFTSGAMSHAKNLFGSMFQ